MRSWLRTAPRYSGLFSEVWLWEDFPSRGDFGGKDTEIDLVARTHEGDYWPYRLLPQSNWSYDFKNSLVH